MQLYVIPAGAIQTNAYLLVSPERGEALLIDAPGDIWAEVGPILSREKCRLSGLWLTHGHWDHMQGAAEVVQATGAVCHAHVADRLLLENPRVMSDFMAEDLNLAPVAVTDWIRPGKPLAALGLEAEVRHVPGHCPGSVLFYFAAAGVAFVGDALFKGGVGRTDLPGGDYAELERSIRTQIYTLPDDTVVYPGHGPATTVGDEKSLNPFVRG
jgi:glyoxylase-like metal-dependent hydrolase (beta-lactamase superfamily II)